jgi:hypothetical protein
MFRLWQMLTIMVVAVAFALSLTHTPDLKQSHNGGRRRKYAIRRTSQCYFVYG